MIIGVDPGTTTGLAVYSRGRVVLEQLPFIYAVNFVWEQIDRDLCEAVVCEPYDLTAGTLKKKRVADPYHAEGALKVKCVLSDVPFIDRYRRSNAKHFATDRKLLHIGWFDPKLEHACDGARQVLCYLADQDPQLVVQLLKGLHGDGRPV